MTDNTLQRKCVLSILSTCWKRNDEYPLFSNWHIHPFLFLIYIVLVSLTIYTDLFVNAKVTLIFFQEFNIFFTMFNPLHSAGLKYIALGYFIELGNFDSVWG